jgi:Zn-dependent peptidase ImmA (M78 family)
MRKFRILVITIVFFAISCKKPIDVSPDTPENDAVNVSLPSLINSFQIEANKRKINVDVNSISVKIKKGLGGAGLWVPTEKTIYLDEDIWNDFDNLEKEVLLFHELGHALLNRGHNNFRSYVN